MTTNGVSIGNPHGVEINGVRCGLVSDVACDYANAGGGMSHERVAECAARESQLTELEMEIAWRASSLLREMYAKGYSKEDTRKAFVQKIVDEAQRGKQTHGDGSENMSSGSEKPTLSSAKKLDPSGV